MIDLIDYRTSRRMYLANIMFERNATVPNEPRLVALRGWLVTLRQMRKV